MVTVSGNSNPTNPTYPTNPTNPTTINSGELTDKNRKCFSIMKTTIHSTEVIVNILDISLPTCGEERHQLGL